MSARMKNALPVVLVLLIAAFVPAYSSAATVDLPDGSKLDLSIPCPICNMKPEESKLGPAAAVFKEGKVVGFDAPGDMFRYVLDPKKYGFNAGDIKEVFVTEHGGKNFIDAKKAFYVVGSDVTGDMGPEVVPFSKKEDAEKFQSEHHGKNVASYVQITLDDVTSKKKMLKMKHDDAGGGMKH
ncbi:MAG: nitrous oxide reductase accessory protein NosL [Desulfomonile tiedjei]|nr:nitrous oxide reductase accessory protein NosL [Desulfomonile tiedjei]